MKFFDLSKQQKIIKKKLNINIKSILDKNLYIQGPEVKELENKLSKFVSSKYCICHCCCDMNHDL